MYTITLFIGLKKDIIIVDSYQIALEHSRCFSRMASLLGWTIADDYDGPEECINEFCHNFYKEGGININRVYEDPSQDEINAIMEEEDQILLNLNDY